MNQVTGIKDQLEAAKARASEALAEHAETRTEQAAQKFIDANDQVHRLLTILVQRSAE